eukprot:gene3693-4211_t
MEQRAELMCSTKLPAINRFGFRPRPLPAISRVMEVKGIGDLSVQVGHSNGSTKSVVFYKNGDRYFQGHQVLLTQRRYRSFDSLLTELTRITKLPHGVRFVFTPSTGRRVNSLEQFEDGKSYVCSSFGKLRRIKYEQIDFNKKTDNMDRSLSTRKDILPRNIDNIRLKPLNYRPDALKEDGTRSVSVSKTPAIKPRLITVIRNGFKPRRVVKVLLNRRTAQNFEQVLDDVTSAVGVIGGSGVRKLYTIEGKRVQGLSDLLNAGAEEVFIAVGDEKFHHHDLQDILKDLNLTTNTSVHENKHKSNHHHHHKKHSKHDIEREVAANKAGKATLLSTTSSQNQADQSSIVCSSRVSLSDDAVSNKSLPTAQRNAKNKNLKLPHISEAEHRSHQNSHGSNNNKMRGKKADNVLPPIPDANNNEQPQQLPETVHASKQAPELKRQVSKRRNQGDYKQEKKPIENIKELFEIGKKLGDGNFAVVRECVHRVTHEKFALKMIDRSKMKGKEKMLDNEIEIMKRCNHQNIVKLLDDYHGRTEIYLIMELVSGGDLFDAISSAVKFSEPEAANYVHDICSSLYYLHKRKIVHRDLKPENLLVSRNSYFCSPIYRLWAEIQQGI